MSNPSNNKEIFSTPLDAPLYPKFPITYRRNRILTVLYRTDQEQIRKIIPSPLESTSDLVTIHYYHMTDAEWFGNYYESAIQVEVELANQDGNTIKGSYSPYLVLGSVGAISAGRELYGQPKKGGKPKLELNGDLIIGRVDRNGLNVMTSTLAYKQSKSNLDELRNLVPFERNINLKIIPNIDGTLAVKQLTARSLKDLVVHECWRGITTTEIHPNAQLPIYQLPVLEMLDGFYWECDFTLPLGETIYDYLQDEGG